MALAEDGRTLYVANRFSNTVSVIDLTAKKVVKAIPTVREPRSVCITQDGKTLAVANFLPAQAATADVVAAEISLISTETNELRRNICLTSGSQSVLGLTASKDGRYLYAVHLLSRFSVPVTQLDRGWVNTNALSIIDLHGDSLYATVLLDDVDHGAANPAAAVIALDRLYIALSGAHELMSIDLTALHEHLTGIFNGDIHDAYIRGKEDLSTSLSFTASVKKRIALKGRMPRSVAVAGDEILVSSRFSPFIERIAIKVDASATDIITLGAEPEPDARRRGELAFNDAAICYQQWQSCASCHPDGRADGLNWDQQNDGLGNPKNTKSLLYSHVTPPCMITGIRENAEKAVRNGILHTLQTRQPESLAADMDEYLKQMSPSESPFLKEYRAKDPKQTGKRLFDKAGCAQCHSGAYLTDKVKYDVGTGDGDDRERPFDTPALREVWRTAPYLYDGRAATLHEVFTVFNAGDRHGATLRLSAAELDALILYLKTL